MNKVTIYHSIVKNKRRNTLMLCLIIVCQIALTETLSTQETSINNMINHIRILSSDNFLGRLPGSKGEELTTKYIANELMQIGIKPGHHGSFYQAVPLLGTQPKRQPKLSVAHQGEKIDLEYGSDFIIESKNLHQNINFKNKEIIFAGFAMQSAADEWDDFKGVDLSNKVVVYLWSDRAIGQNKSVFGKDARSRHGMRGVKAQKAAAHGAAAAFIIHTQEQAGYPWEVLGKPEPQWVYSINSENQQKPTMRTTGMFSARAGEKLFTAVGMNLQAAMEKATDPNFEPFSLSQNMTLKFKKHIRKLESNNIIGMLPAAQSSNEYVIYTAHWDHMGQIPGSDDTIFNGAVDNATGVAMLLELARRYRELDRPPKRNIIFMATTAEEQGLLGAHYYADHPSVPLHQTSAVINMDSAFPFGSLKGMNVTGYGHSEVEIYLEQAANKIGRTLIPGSQPQFGAFFRSDHYPFAAKGIPAIFAMGSPTAQQLEEQPELLEKFINFGKNHYHKASDEFNQTKWDMTGIYEDMSVLFNTGLAIANDNKKPNWYLHSEFRAIRDQQLITD